MERQEFIKRLDILAQNALSKMSEQVVNDMYWAMLENFDNEFSGTEDQLQMLENNMSLIKDRDYLEMGVAA